MSTFQLPILQFWRMIQWAQQDLQDSIWSSPEKTFDTFFYMECDTVPVQEEWLDVLRSEMIAKAPFAVLGSRYSGHNWNRLVNHDPPMIPDALL
jgi:hypothetical protein